MAVCGGNFLCKTSLGLQFRVLLIPWMNKSSSICCMNGRANSSSFPVKYIPKKSRKTEEPQTSSTPMKGRKGRELSTGLDENGLSFEVSNVGTSSQRSFVLDKESQNQTQTRIHYFTNDANEGNFTPTKGPKGKVISNGLEENELRCEVSNGGKSSQRGFVLDKTLQNQNQTPSHYFAHGANEEVDEEINFDEGVLESEEVVEELEVYMGKNPHNQDVLQFGNTKQDAEKSAIELLAKRAYTAVELRKKLQGKKYPLDTVDSVISDFQSRGLINDCLYAETFSQSRWSSSTWGPRRIKQALFKKGVSAVEAEKAIKLVFQDTDSGEDQESRHGLSKVSMDKLFVQASKQWLRGRDITNETRKSRIVRWLQYRGFNWDVISFILKKLESQTPP